MKKNMFKKFLVLILILIFLVMTISMVFNFKIFNKKNLASIPKQSSNPVRYEHLADPNTMENYKDLLLSEKNGSRYAGRIWSDKSVLAYGKDNTLSLTDENDGVSGTINYNADFLHVFSTIGSSQKLNRTESKPVDVVLLLDISTSMTVANDGKIDDNDSLHQLIKETNSLIKKLMDANSDNRVAVVVYGGGAQVVLNLGHYTPQNGNENYLEISATSMKTGNKAYFTKIKPTVKEEVKDNKESDYMYADATYLQGALYEGMNILATEENTTYFDKIEGQRLARTPVLVCLTDGATNIISCTSTSAEKDPKKEYDWWEPYIGVIDTAGKNLQYAADGANPYYADCNGSTGNGQSGQSGRNSVENRNLEIQAIAPRNVSNLLLAGSMKKEIEDNYQNTMLDYSIAYNVNGLGTYANEQLLGTLDPEEYFDEKRDGLTELAKKEVEATKETIEKYINDEEAKLRFPRDTNKEHIFLNTGGTHANFTYNHPDNETYLSDNDIEEFEDVCYVDEYYTAESGKIGEVFNKILEQITGEIFTPISGTNDSGVSDSITYMDPLGEYMEIKDNSVNLDGAYKDMALVLFGQKYGLTKAGIYDYKFNVEHMKDSSFKSGWYDNETGEYLEDQNNGNWNTATYYLDGSTTRQYVSTLDEEKITEKQKNTVYTMYRFENNNDAGNEIENPCYSKEDEKVKFKLNDIRVWIENTGDYIDESNGATVDLGYDQALYLNIPSAALPIQTATIDLDKDGKVLKYETNLNDSGAKPFRLFYTVGIQDEVRGEKGNTIDLSKLSSEYIQKNTDENGYVNFYSNYYSGKSYDGYITDQQNDKARSMGDPNFSFSPNKSNRYYSYQKPLVLYKNESGNYNEISEVEYQATGEYKTYEEFKKSLENKKVTDSNDIGSDKKYYIELDYYMPEKQKTATHVLVTRTGAEFGSGLAGGTIDYGEYLVWYDESTGKTVDFVKGQEKPSEGNYVLATKPEGLRVGNMAQSYIEKSENKTNTSSNVYLPTISSNSTAKDNNIIINAYFGNNGVLRVKNTLLEVTKEVKVEHNEQLTDEEFDFELKIPAFGEDNITQVDAVSLKKNSKYKEGESDVQKWLVQLDTIDILTDNGGFLVSQTDSSTRIEKDGKYIWLGSNEQNGYRLYNSQDGEQTDGNVRIEEKTNGSVNYYGKVYLVPKEEVDGKETVTLPGNYTSEEMLLYTVDATKEVKQQASSEYATRATYARKQLTFDNNGVCSFTLKDGEGILIEGLDDSFDYEVTEKLNDRLYDLGYRFDSVYDYQGNKFELEDNSTTVKDEHTSSTTIDEVHYVNVHKILGDLSISKTITGSDVVAQGDRDSGKDWTFVITLTPPAGSDLGDTYSYRYYDITDQTLEKVLGTLTVNKNEDGTYSGEMKVKHNQNISIKEIEPGTKYKVTEKEADQNDYSTSIENAEGTINVEYDKKGDFLNNNIQVSCINENLAEIDLTIRKEVKGLGGDTEKDWNFQITLTPPEGKTLKDSYEYDGSKTGVLNLTKNKNGTYTGNVTLKHNEYITIQDLPENTAYVVEELEAKKDGYATEIPENSKGMLTGNENVDMKFVNSKVQYYALTVKKSVVGNVDNINDGFKFKITFTPSQNLEFATSYLYSGSKSGTLNLTNNNDGTYSGIIELKNEEFVTIENIPEETIYKVEELDANKDGYMTVVPGDAEGKIDSANKNPNVTFINKKYELKDLTIKKLVEGNGGDKNKDWTFNITLIPEEGLVLNSTYSYTGSKSGEITFTKQDDETYKGSVTLKHGESITIKDIPEKTEYKVEEDEANKESYETTIDGRDVGILVEDNTEVVFRNKKYAEYDLTIEKNVVSENTEAQVDSSTEWEFNVTLIPAEGKELKESYNCEGKENGTISLKNNNDGTYTFSIKLKHQEKFTVKGLPEGTKYKVDEVKANQDGYVTSDSGNTQGSLDKESKTIKFTNTQLPAGSLTIAKEVHGGAGNKNKEWTFHIELSNLTQGQETVSYSYTGRSLVSGVTAPAGGSLQFKKQEDNTYHADITLKHGQGITLKDIPKDTHFTVTEAEANSNGYVTKVGTQTGTIDDKSAVLVEYSNTLLDKLDLTISKKVDGFTGDKQKDWTFNITLIPENDENFDGSFAYTGSKNGNITFVKQEDGFWHGSITLKHDEKITIKDLPEGTKYKVEEVDFNKDGYVTKVKGQNPGVLFDENVSVEFTNTLYSKFDLAIKKIVDGEYGDKNKEWEFDVIVSLPDSQEDSLTKEIERRYINSNGEEEKKTEQLTLNKNAIGNYKTTLKIKHGETIVIKELPENAQYSIFEKEANTGGYLTTYTNSNGSISSDKIVSEFVNKYVSKLDLTIEKIVRGSGNKRRSWTFEITLMPTDSEQSIDNSYDYVGNKKNGKIDFVKQEDGSYKGTISLVHEETITLKGLPAEVKYDVQELEANENDYVTTTQGKTAGELSVDTEKITFFNTRLEKVGLTIEKLVKGNAGDKEREWNFEILLIPLEGTKLEKTYKFEGTKSGTIEFVKNDDGTYKGSIKLKNEDKITILDLPEETKYTVLELEANQDGYITNTAGSEGMLAKDGSAYVLFENIKEIAEGTDKDKYSNSPYTGDNIRFTMVLFIISIIQITVLSRYISNYNKRKGRRRAR